ncbi:predicted protein [Nematostella vectensis]|uniref:Uncharacterized protein n=1 Tax=Nematostella vectensis TaxID=45351 RepID=A7RX32_NEMVE|nr:predicted protein [Nematostella vectensis]|eukprot:XP_001635960.1 predicted protein [Nematostella vectensis]
MEAPLFGETRPRDRYLNYFIGVATSLLVLIFWYRRGDLDPKFRQLIYYNCFTLVLLCVCANVFFYDNKL